MANLEQLNFNVILNDTEFNAKVGEMLQKANELNTTLSNLLNVKGSISPVTAADVESARNLNRILKDNLKTELEMERKRNKERNNRYVDDAAAEARERKEITKAREQEQREIIKTLQAQERLNRLQKEGNSLLGKSSRLWREMSSMVLTYFSIRGATSLIRTLTRVSAEFEMQRVTLGAILNDTQAAGKLFGQLKELAVRSPFQFKDLATYAKQLSAYSIPVNELYETTKMLADVSAGLGVGMDRLVLAYGQIRSASFLRGQEVRQLTEAGIPILVELRKQFVELGEEGITVADVFDKISKRMVPFEMVEKVFKNMTEEGGKFFEMQEVQAETLKGKISNLTDAYQIMFSEIGDKKSGLLKGAVDLARSLADNYEKVGRAIVALVAAYGAYKAMAMAVKVIEETTLIAKINHVKTTQALSKAIKILTADSAAFAAVEKAIMSINPWAMLGAAVAAVGAYLVSASVQAARFKKELNGVADAQLRTADKAVKGFKDLVDQLRMATEGSQNYRDAISKLNNQYSEYLPNLLNEKNALLEIAKAEREVTNAIYARARAYAESEGIQKIEEKEGKKVSQATNALLKALRGKTLAEDVADDFIKGFRDALQSSESDINTVFHDTLKNYLGDDYYRWGEESIRYWNEISNAAQEYGESVRAVSDATKDYQRVLDLRFGQQGYSSAEERKHIGEVEQKYAKKEAEIRNQSLTAEEAEQALLDNKIAKLNEMLATYRALNLEAKEIGKEGAWDNQIRDIQNQLDALKPGDDSWLMKIVNPVIQGNGVRDLLAQMEDGYDEYVDKIRKEYKDVTETFADAQKTYNGLVADKQKGLAVDEAVLAKAKEQYDLLEHRQKVIEDIGEALHISVNDKLRKASSGGTSGKSAEQVELEMRRDTLKDLLKWYDKLKDAGMDSQSIRNMLVAYFPDQNEIINAENYKEVLIEIANALEKYDKKAAQALRDDMGLNGIDQQFEQWKRAKKAAEDYEDFMKDWLESSELFGEGSEFNISKVIDRYGKELAKIDNKREEALKRAATTATLDTGFDFDAALEEVTDKTITEKANALKVANEDIRKEAEKWVKNWEGLGDIDLSHMADLTARELTKLQDKLAELASNPDEYFGDMAEQLKAAGLDIGIFKEAVLKAIDEINGQAEEKKWMEIVRQVKRYKQALDVSINSVEKLAEATRDPALKGFADDLDKAADAAVKMVEALANGDTFGAIMAIVTHVADVWMDAISASIEFKHAVDDLTLSFQEMRYAADLATGVESIFGHNTFRAIQNAYNLITSLSSTMRGLEGTLTSITVSTQKSKWWEFILAPTAPAAWAKLFTNKNTTIMELLAETGAELYDEMGRVNVEALQKISDTYDNFSDKEKKALEQAIVDAKAYNDALDQLDDAMGSLVGGIADDFASKIVEQWKVAGNAAADYGDILDDIATQYAEMFVKNTIMDNIFNGEFKDMLTSLTLSRDSSGVMDLFAKKVKELEEYYPFFEDVLNSLSGYFTEESASKSNTLGGGIKSITEDTANLLASYVNAIRADVAAIRQAMVAQAGLTTPAPTLAEYLTQIQANTYNNAVAAQNILERLDSVMTMSDGPAFRVFM